MFSRSSACMLQDRHVVFLLTGVVSEEYYNFVHGVWGAVLLNCVPAKVHVDAVLWGLVV